MARKLNGVNISRHTFESPLRMAMEIDEAGVQSHYIYGSGINSPDYMILNGENFRIVKDHLGSPRLVISANTGTIVQRMDFNEWGEVLFDSNPGFQGFGFAGGLYDQDTKLVKFGARDYSPAVGRWLSKDPIGFSGGDANLYGYVLQDPVNLADPNGKSAIVAGLWGGFVACGPVCAAIGAGAGAWATYAISKKLSEFEWKKLLGNTGEHPEQIKERLVGGEGKKWDLYKEKDGRITIRPKNGKANPIDTDYNEDDLKRNRCGEL